MRDNKRTMSSKVKEVVDFVYELLNGNDWVKMNSTDFGDTGRRIITNLVKRKILIRSRCYTGGRGVYYKYKWMATMAPTVTLYKNITNDMTEYNRKKWERRVAAIEESKRSYQTVTKTDECPTRAIEGEVNLEGVSSKELYNELLRRGFCIDNGRPQLIQREYLDV